MTKRIVVGMATSLALIAVAGSAAAQDFVPKREGTWIINTRVTTVDPDAGDPILTRPGGVDTTLDAVVSSDTMPTLGFTYFLTDNLAVEAILGTTQHTVRATNLPVASTRVLPPVVSLQYHFSPDAKVSPYVGAGLNYMLFYNERNIAPFTDFDIKNGVGYALQAGVDVAVKGPWSINLDVKKVFFNTTARTTLAGPGPLISDVDLDPWVASVGLGYRFGQ